MAPSFLEVPQHPRRVDKKDTGIDSIPNALSNCNPTDRTCRLFLKQFLMAHAGQAQQAKPERSRLRNDPALSAS
jgi:hypothetical protein